jgi:hypothetical protein
MEHAGRQHLEDFNLVGALQIHGKNLALVGLLALLLGGPSCASPEPKSPAPEQLPSFSAEDATLFDDSFSAAVFSTDARPDIDHKLYLRSRQAESVLPASIATVTEDRGSDGEHVYTLELRPTGPPLAGAVVTERVALTVSPASPSYGVLRNLGASLIGAPVILFFRRYKDDGLVSVHWRAEPDREEVRQAVERARFVSEYRQ